MCHATRRNPTVRPVNGQPKRRFTDRWWLDGDGYDGDRSPRCFSPTPVAPKLVVAGREIIRATLYIRILLTLPQRASMSNSKKS
ncbi:MAG: hypothetical protein E5X04_00930 [Mesorhizobium sp.]|nr:MAG: hypothetical protein E5X04_00930 [Mesorhizobium sp.]